MLFLLSRHWIATVYDPSTFMTILIVQRRQITGAVKNEAKEPNKEDTKVRGAS
jgi:hypothetical protein